MVTIWPFLRLQTSSFSTINWLLQVALLVELQPLDRLKQPLLVATTHLKFGEAEDLRLAQAPGRVGCPIFVWEMAIQHGETWGFLQVLPSFYQCEFDLSNVYFV